MNFMPDGIYEINPKIKINKKIETKVWEKSYIDNAKEKHTGWYLVAGNWPDNDQLPELEFSLDTLLINKKSGKDENFFFEVEIGNHFEHYKKSNLKSFSPIHFYYYIDNVSMKSIKNMLHSRKPEAIENVLGKNDFKEKFHINLPGQESWIYLWNRFYFDRGKIILIEVIALGSKEFSKFDYVGIAQRKAKISVNMQFNLISPNKAMLRYYNEKMGIP